MYVSNMGEFWNAFMASVAARRLTSQHLLCNNLRELEGRRLTGDSGGLLDRMDWQDRTRWSLDDFEQNRLALLLTILENCSLSLQHPLGPPKALLFSSITALLVSIRAYASEDSKSRQDGQYALFCQAVVRACRDKLVETLQRGVLVEMQKTAAVVEAMVKGTDGCG